MFVGLLLLLGQPSSDSGRISANATVKNLKWTLRELNELAAGLSHQVSGLRHAKSQSSSRSISGPFDSRSKHQSFARDAR